MVTIKSDNIYKATIKKRYDLVWKNVNSQEIALPKLIEEDVLVYKKDQNRYRNIQNGIIYDKDDILTLVPIHKMFGVKKRLSTKEILILYNNHLRELLKLGDLYIGDLGKTQIVYSVEPISKGKDSGLTKASMTMSIKEFACNRLLLRRDNCFTDLETYIDYYNTYNLALELHVLRPILFSDYFSIPELKELLGGNEDSVERGKLLVKYRKEIKEKRLL